MNLIKYRPIARDVLGRDFDRLFGDLFDGNFWDFENRYLTVDMREEKDGYIMRERKGYAFARSFVLPDDVNANDIKAEFKNGVLYVKLAKNPETQPKKIEVKGS